LFTSSGSAQLSTARTLARPTPDGAFAAQGAAISIEWGQSYQRGDLFAPPGSEVGQVGQQRRADHRAHTWDTPQCER
jgi:hypothetical protein